MIWLGMLAAGALSGLQVVLWRYAALRQGTEQSMVLALGVQFLGLTVILALLRPSFLTAAWQGPAALAGIAAGAAGLVFLWVFYRYLARAADLPLAFALFVAAQVVGATAFSGQWPRSAGAYVGLALMLAGVAVWRLAGGR